MFHFVSVVCCSVFVLSYPFVVRVLFVVCFVFVVYSSGVSGVCGPLFLCVLNVV